MVDLTIPEHRAAAPERIAPLQPQVSVGSDCATVRQRLAIYAAAGFDRAICVTIGAPQVSAAVAGSAGLQAAAGTWCDSVAGANWWVTRTEACMHTRPVMYTVIETPSGKVLGTAKFEVAQEIALSVSKAEVLEDASVKLVNATNALASPKATFSAKCAAPCATTDGTGFTGEVFSLNEIQDAFLTYTANPTSNKQSFGLSYSFTVAAPAGTVPVVPTVTWTGPTTIRCDDLVGGNEGCIFPFYEPTLDLPVTQFGAGAMTVLFAQANLPDSWGAGKALHREGDDKIGDTNRSKVCDSTFVKDPTVTNDSCDEYAFAQTKESGAQFGLTGKDCAEVTISKNAAGNWTAKLIRYTGQERCLRAHVPTAENTAVGGELGRFTTAQRLLDNDPYWVDVY